MRSIKLSRNEKLILKDMVKAGRPLSIMSIAKRNEIHWKTARRNIESLRKEGIVNCSSSKKGGKIQCMINPKLRR